LITRVQELCRQLKPVLGTKIDRLWSAYLAESDPGGKADIEQTLELLAAKHLGKSYEPDRSPFPPPSRKFAGSGDIRLGTVSYGGRKLYPFYLKSDRLKEHILVAGRSGSGKTNLTFVLMEGIVLSGIKVLALDWKRGYRDLVSRHKDLRVYTIGRDVAPFRFNPLIPPAGCEPHLWIKLIVDVIASAYLGGEGVISLLVAGLDHLYSEFGVFDQTQTGWPTIQDLLAWLRTAKLKGRAAMWQASAERILLGMTYGEYGAVLNTQENSHVAGLLDHNVVLETSIRMVRQYGLGYVFVDQSASLLSKVAFANSYATLALSQKLRSDVQAIAAAMNLTDEQKQALNTLSVGTAVVRLADEHPEPFLVRVPLFPIREGSVSDSAIRAQLGSCYGDTKTNSVLEGKPEAISPIPLPDRKDENNRNDQQNRSENTRPPSPKESAKENASSDSKPGPPRNLSPEEKRFLTDIIARPLSTTVSRYHRLSLSRRRGNAVRESLSSTGVIERSTIATRCGQVVLFQLTDHGRVISSSLGIDPGPKRRESLEHMFWVDRAAKYFEKEGYKVAREHPVKGNGAVDVLAQRPGEKIAVEIETGKSDTKENLTKIAHADFDRIVLVATSPAGSEACQKAMASVTDGPPVQLLTWLDVS